MNVFGVSGKGLRIIVIALIVFIILTSLFENRRRMDNMKETEKYSSTRFANYTSQLSSKLQTLEMKFKKLNYSIVRSFSSNLNLSTVTKKLSTRFANYTSHLSSKLQTLEMKFKKLNYSIVRPTPSNLNQSPVRPLGHQTFLLTRKKCVKPFKLLIFVPTHISHFNARQTIRNTWRYDSNQRWTTRFVVGRVDNATVSKQLDKEIIDYEDISQAIII